MANKMQMGVFGKSLKPSMGKKNDQEDSYVAGTKNNPRLKAKSLTPKAKMKKK